jgi:SAM-dependent methyltransferase
MDERDDVPGEGCAEQRSLLENLGFPSESKKLAIDLGCAPGYQSVALCDLSYVRVIAIDTSQSFLDELGVVGEVHPIEHHLTDLRGYAAFADVASADTIVCMGDTITYSESTADVSWLFGDAFMVLRPGGRLALTFRDLSTELKGTDRIIPVRAEDQRIMTCVLLYEPGHVVVNDLVHVRSDEGWKLHKSCYRKLRLNSGSVAEELRQIGFSVESETSVNRMQVIVARKM